MSGFAIPYGSTGSYSSLKSGEKAGSASVAQVVSTDVPCQMVVLAALPTNSGNVYIGASSGVTVPAGTTDLTSGIPLEPGDIVVMPISNLNLLWRICDNDGDDVAWFAMS